MKNMMIAMIVAICLINVVGCAHAKQQPVTAMYVIGSTNSYILQHRTLDMTNGTQQVFWVDPQGPGIGGFEMWVHPPDWSVLWTVELVIPTSRHDLRRGSYLNTRELDGLPSTTIPRLTFGGDGRASSKSIGWFRVLEFTRNHNGSVKSAAIDFYQADIASVNSWEFGSIRFNSKIPITTVEDKWKERFWEPKKALWYDIHCR